MTGHGYSTDVAVVDTASGGHHNPKYLRTRCSGGAALGKDMTNEELFRELATRACCEALLDSLQEKSRELAEDVARRMGSALETPAAQPAPSQRACCRQLRDGALLISNSRTQTETLEALLAAGTSAVTAACGLMIVRGTQASG
jgi:hypothetical protein